VALDITRTRLRNQRLSGGRFTTPEEVVRWLGAVQAQEYGHAKWALGLRMQRARDARIEAAIGDGRILRTHVMRPTWHFVAPDDIRWMLALTAPRVSAAIARYNRRLELDGAVFRRSQRAIRRRKSTTKRSPPPVEPQRSNHPTEAVRGLAEAHSGRGRQPRVDGCPEGPP